MERFIFPDNESLGRAAAADAAEHIRAAIRSRKRADIILATGTSQLKTLDALIAAAQKVEHYEISSYGTARAWARKLGFGEAARLLQETLDEEARTDEKLTQLAESHINQQAER